jgi:hypothetical protein
MPQNIYGQQDEKFLEYLGSLAKEWGWNGDEKEILEQRMLRENIDLGHPELADPANGYLRLSSQNENLAQLIADTLAKKGKIYDRLTPLGLPERNWKVAQRFLYDVLFPEWLKNQVWGILCEKAKYTDRIEVKVEKFGIATAKPCVRLGDEILIPEIPLGSHVNYEVLETADRYVILLERDGDGGISCLSPSRVFPRFAVGGPASRSGLLAVISAQEPKLSWLEKARSNWMLLSYRS